jgi:hypothetical protein
MTSSPAQPARRPAPALLTLILASSLAGCSDPAAPARHRALGEPSEDAAGVLRDFRDSRHEANRLYRNREVVFTGRLLCLTPLDEEWVRATVECGAWGDLLAARFGARWRAELAALAPGELVCLRGAILSGGPEEDGTLALSLGGCELLHYPRRRSDQARSPFPRPAPVRAED